MQLQYIHIHGRLITCGFHELYFMHRSQKFLAYVLKQKTNAFVTMHPYNLDVSNYFKHVKYISTLIKKIRLIFDISNF